MREQFDQSFSYVENSILECFDFKNGYFVDKKYLKFVKFDKSFSYIENNTIE